LRLSLVTATLATALCLILGVPLAWLLARSRIRGRRLLRALVTVPLVLPPVVGGVALLLVHQFVALRGICSTCSSTASLVPQRSCPSATSTATEVPEIQDLPMPALPDAACEQAGWHLARC
jgi:ABC-type nitrate/sulfonate/bicarbonate transport system permease component